MVRSNASDIAGRYLGKNWPRRFKKRHPQVITARPAKLDPKRAKHFNKTIINDYFDKWEELNEQYDGGIPPEHIWNMDEKGIQMGGGRKNNGKGYFYLRDYRNRYRISSDNLELVTVIECVSAAGDSAPTAFVLSDGPLPDLRKLVSDESFGGIGRSPSGWTDNEICQEWLEQKFMPFACSKRVDKSKPIVLILDGHESHENWELRRRIYAFSDCEVIVFCFPSKTTHKLQPLDVVVFNPVGRKWREHCDMTLHKGITISRYNVVPEYLEVRKKAVTKDLIRTAFVKTGIYPVNRNVFSEEDFAPSMASSSCAHVPASFPDDVPSSDAAIPTDAESEGDSDYCELESDNGDEDLVTESNGKRLSDGGDPSDDLEQELCDPEAPQERVITRSSVATLMDISNLTYHCRTVPFEVDKQKSHEALLNEVRELRQQLHTVYDAFRMQEASTEAANAHCTIVKRALADCRTQLQNSNKTRERGSSKIKARFLSGEKMREAFEAADAERQERERADAEKETQKLAELEARNARITEDATSKVFDHTLASYTRKDELLSLAGALRISDKGTIPDLLSRIRQHMELHPELRENPRFAGLFQTSGARGRRNGPAATASTSESWSLDAQSAPRPAPPITPAISPLGQPQASTSAFHPIRDDFDIAPAIYYPPTSFNYTNPYSYFNLHQPNAGYYDTNH
ncbi:hypothetical protein M378DRAFT_86304 [Amanita muscaria Koide BX008]|uniref:HTH CENPB-type domain-containing protein n=1 Tax=Amanita muscaria (strain Koide BX008) TaxID=946122 RepID=A0A0C2WQR3_AMAMK|nr:hypothetical protein M378DRAFT_86304 [Amanita muscaria Koide BX008]